MSAQQPICPHLNRALLIQDLGLTFASTKEFISPFTISPFARFNAPPQPEIRGRLPPLSRLADTYENIDTVARQPNFYRSLPPPTPFPVPQVPHCPVHHHTSHPLLASRLPPLQSPTHFGPSVARLPSSTDPSPIPQTPQLPRLRATQPTNGNFPAAHPSSDDYYLNQLATQTFSSSSALNENPRQSTNAAGASQDTNPVSGIGGQPANIKREDDSDGDTRMPSRSHRSRRESGGSLAIDAQQLPAGSTACRRNATRMRSSPQSAGGQAVRKRKREESIKIEDDAFGSDDLQIIDLANTEEVPASLRAPPKPKNYTRLSTFQCVICMDNVTDLTVTHCGRASDTYFGCKLTRQNTGHLFCSECLHSSLHIDAHKKICPICRQKIDTKPPGGKFGSRAKGYYPLELKLTTKKSLGKRTDKA